MATTGKLTLRAWGAFMLGQQLTHLNWGLNAVNQPTGLAALLFPLQEFANIHPFEEIGIEAGQWYDSLVNSTDSTINPLVGDNLKSSVIRWHTLVQERLERLFLITPVTSLDPKRLLEGLNGFLFPEEIGALAEIELLDLQEATRCILLSAPTAAERMALRAAESLLRRWYQRTTGKQIRRQTWSKILDRLIKEYPEGKRPKEIVLLGYLKERRNELDHPEKISSQSEAETTLMNVFTLTRDIQPLLAAANSRNDAVVEAEPYIPPVELTQDSI